MYREPTPVRVFATLVFLQLVRAVSPICLRRETYGEQIGSVRKSREKKIPRERAIATSVSGKRVNSRNHLLKIGLRANAPPLYCPRSFMPQSRATTAPFRSTERRVSRAAITQNSRVDGGGRRGDVDRPNRSKDSRERFARAPYLGCHAGKDSGMKKIDILVFRKIKSSLK